MQRVFCAQDFFGCHAAPGLDAALFHNGCRLVNDLHGAWVQLARILVQEEGQGHAPAALARDAPVGPPCDHVAQAALAVFGVEAGLLDGCQGRLAQRARSLVGGEHAFAFVHAHEPLGGGAVNHRRLVAPAVRVAVGDVLGGHQAARVAQRLDDDGDGLPDVLAAEQREVCRISAVALHRVQDVVVLHAVRHARVEVVHAVGGRRVHDTRAVGGRGVVGQVHGREAAVAMAAVFTGHVVQRVLKLDAAQPFARNGGQHLALQAPALHAGIDQCFGDHVQAALGLHQRVRQLGVQVQRLVGGDGPGRGGPDHGKRVLREGRHAKGRRQRGRVVGLEGHVQRGALLVLVLDFKLGQRRAAVKAPVHGLEAAVHEATLHYLLERADLAGFAGEVHGLVRVVPVAEHAQALEVGHLLCDLLGGKGSALGLHFVTRQVAAVQLFNGVFNGQTVAVPAGHVQRVKAFELTRLGDHVLEDLVDRVANVQLAVGIGRAVVQDELGRTATGIAQLFVDAFVFPLLHPAGLALGQVAAHGEGCVWQVQRGAVVHGRRAVRGGGAGVIGHERTLERCNPGRTRREKRE